jgi:hypothetical protein
MKGRLIREGLSPDSAENIFQNLTSMRESALGATGISTLKEALGGAKFSLPGQADISTLKTDLASVIELTE